MIKQRTFALIIALTVGFMLLSALWIDHTKLKQTVFIPQYSDNLAGAQSFTIFYLEDVNTKQPVQSIQIEGLSYKTNKPQERNIIGRNRLNSITFNPIDNMDYADLENQIFTKATVFYPNGITESLVFGELHLHSNQEKQPILHPITTGSSSNGEHLFIAKTSAKIEITKVELSFPTIVNPHLTTNMTTTKKSVLNPEESSRLVTGATYPLDELSLPLTFEADQFIRMEFQQHGDLFTNYDADVVVHGINLDTGEAFRNRIGMITHQLQQEQHRLIEYIKEARRS